MPTTNVQEVPSFPVASDAEIEVTGAWTKGRMDLLTAAADRSDHPGQSRVTWLGGELAASLHAMGEYDVPCLRRFLMWSVAWRLNIGYTIFTAFATAMLLVLVALGVHGHHVPMIVLPFLPMVLGLYWTYRMQRFYADKMMENIRPGLRRSGESLNDWMRRWETECPEGWREPAIAKAGA